MISTAEDRRYGRHSSPHPVELRLVAGGAAYPGETVVLWRADYAPAPIITCPVCEGRRVAPPLYDGPVQSCDFCDGRGEYLDPGAPVREIARHEIARYMVQPGDHWRAPDLCNGTCYHAVIVPEPREVVPREWDHVLGAVVSKGGAPRSGPTGSTT